MTIELYNKLKQEAEELSDELRNVLINLETRRGKIKKEKDQPSVERNLYKHIESVICNAEGTLIVAHEALIGLSEVEDETELINYMSQYD
jgi:hypothetical protein